MDPNYQPIVRKISQEQSFTGGVPSDVVRVEYTIGGHGPFVERFAKGEFNAEAVKRVMEATAAVLQSLGATSVV